MIRRWQDGFAAVFVTLVITALVILDLTDERFRSWWAARALTTDILGGLLVLLITVLVADQVVNLRRIKDRSRVTAAQAAILMTQAARAAGAVSSVLEGSGNREAGVGEVQTYMTMLLIATPMLIDAPVPRRFLEQAQRLAAEMARELINAAKAAPATVMPHDGLDETVARMRAAAAPLLAALNSAELSAAGASDDAPSAPVS